MGISCHFFREFHLISYSKNDRIGCCCYYSLVFYCFGVEQTVSEAFYFGKGGIPMQRNKMETNKVLKLIISMSIPPALSMIIQSLYNIIDSMYITHFDERAMNAISLVFPIQNLILALAVGIGIGINANISMRLGQKDMKSAETVATHGFFMSFLHYGLVLLLGLSVSNVFIQSFTQDTVIIDYANTYILWIILFSFTTIFQIALEKVLQADGKMMLPMISLLVGAVINLVLDPILIFNCNLGVLGAAIATVTSQVVSTIIMVYFVLSKRNRIRLSFRHFKLDKAIVFSIYKIGIPSFFITAIPSFMVSIMNYILIRISELAVTTFGIYYKLQNFVYMGVSGICQGTMPIMSYHFGAKNFKRLKQVTKNALFLAIGIGVIATILFLTGPELLLSMFYKENELVQACAPLLRMVALGFTFGCMNYLMSSYFQSVQKGITSLIISISRQLVLLIPLTILFCYFYQEQGVYISIAVSELITFGFVSVFYMLHYHKTLLI